MREKNLSKFLLCSTVLSVLSFSTSVMADTLQNSYEIYNAVTNINNASTTPTTVTTTLSANSNPDIIINASNVSELTQGGAWVVQKSGVDWTIDGTQSQPYGKTVLGTIGTYVPSSTSVSGSITVKNIGGLKAGVDYSDYTNLSGANVSGFLTNLTTYLQSIKDSSGAVVGLNGVTNSTTSSIFAYNTDLNVIESVIYGATTGTSTTSAKNNSAGITVTDVTTTFTGENTPTLDANIFGNAFISNTTYGNGGAVNAYNTNLTLEQNIFSGNRSISAGSSQHEGIGGALYFAGDGDIDNNIFYNNSATQFGGGAYIHSGSDVASSGNVFKSNKAQTSGGAVQNLGSWSSTNDQFVQNSAALGGAISNTGIAIEATTGNSTYAPGSATISNALFDSNTATAMGGAIINQGSVTVGSGTSFVDNKVTNGDGGAVYNTQSFPSVSAVLTVDGATFEGNSATGKGGAIYNDGGTVNIANATFDGNTAAQGGAIYNTGTLNIGSSESGKGASTVSFKNTASATSGASDSSAIYNTGTVNIVGAGDSIDLDYSPYVDRVVPSTANRLFADGQTVHNTGTLNIKNSSLQLHSSSDLSQGVINTNTNKVGTVNVDDSRIDIGKSTLYANEVNLNEGTELLTHVNAKSGTHFGKISAQTITVDTANTELTIIVKSGEHMDKAGDSKVFQILDADTVNNDFATITENKMYTITKEGEGAYRLTKIGGSEEPGTGGGSGEKICPDGGCIHNAWVEEGAMTGHTKAEQIQDILNEKAQTIGCDSKEYQDALAGIAPDISPLIQAHSTEITRRLAGIISNQLYTSMERTGYIHRGKRFYKFPYKQSRLWVQGLYGQSEFSGEKGFDMDTHGLAVGFDTPVGQNSKLGFAYSYTTGEGTAVQRDTEVTSHTAMIYGGYNPDRFYANWLALYTRSSYEENKKVFGERVKAEYDVDVIGGQIMLGNKMGPFVVGDWASGVLSPEVGLRYTYIKQHGYTDQAGQKVGASDGQILTGILGAQYTIGYTLSPGVAWYPELRAALTYDFIQPDMENSVTLVNGSHYKVVTENLDKFGIEIGARIGLDINRKTEIAIEYEGLFKGDYTNHTGLASLKYKF